MVDKECLENLTDEELIESIHFSFTAPRANVYKNELIKRIKEYRKTIAYYENSLDQISEEVTFFIDGNNKVHFDI